MEVKQKAEAAKKRASTKTTLLMIASVVAGFLIWALIVNRWVDPLYWPKLPSLALAAKELGIRVLTYSIASTYRVVLGYVIGSLLGILVAYAMSWNKTLDALITPYITVLRPIPAIAFIPFFILWFGIGDLGKVLMIAMGNFVVMVITTLEGIHQLDKIYLQAATILGATKASIYRTVIFPATLPAIMGGLRVTATSAFGLVIVAEMLGARSGLGYLLIVAKRTMSTDVMLLAVIILGLLAFTFDRVVLWIGRFITRWL